MSGSSVREHRPSFSGLLAAYVDCAGVEVGERALVELSVELMRGAGAAVDRFHAADEPARIAERVLAADILVLVDPMWLGDNVSATGRVVDSLYKGSALLNDKGQFAYYGRVGGVLLSGDIEGTTADAAQALYHLQHIGYTIAPQADAGSAGATSADAERDVTFATYNLMHLATLLKSAGGIPAYNNQPALWENGSH